MFEDDLSRGGSHQKQTGLDLVQNQHGNVKLAVPEGLPRGPDDLMVADALTPPDRGRALRGLFLG